MAHHQGMTLLSLAYVLRDRPMQRRFDSRSGASAPPSCCCRSGCRATPAIYPHPAEVSASREAAPERRVRPAGLHDAEHARARGAPAVERPLPRRDHQRGRRLQPLARPGRHALARGPDARLLGHVLLPARRRRAARSGRPRTSRRSTGARATRRSSRRAAPSSAAATATSRPTSRSASRPRTTSSCAGSASPTAARDRRTLELTSYAEVVLAPPAADAAHPAFSNLFVQTELLRGAAGDPVHAAAALGRRATAVDAPPDDRPRRRRSGATSYETGRAAFIGRGRSAVGPGGDAPRRARRQRGLGARSRSWRSATRVVLEPRRDGADPPRHRRRRDPRGRARARREVPAIATRPTACFELSWTHSQVVLRRLDATEADTQLYERLASNVLYANPALRAPAQRHRAQPQRRSRRCGRTASRATSRSCCSGSRTCANLALVRQLVQAHAYWRLKGLAADLVIWNEDPSGYRQVLQEEILARDRHRRRTPACSTSRAASSCAAATRCRRRTRCSCRRVARVIIADTGGHAGAADGPSRPRAERPRPAARHRAPIASGHPSVRRRSASAASGRTWSRSTASAASPATDAST